MWEKRYAMACFLYYENKECGEDVFITFRDKFTLTIRGKDNKQELLFPSLEAATEYMNTYMRENE